VISKPLVSWRHIDVDKPRTKVEFVEQMRQLGDEHYLDALCIRMVLDNFNTHTEYAFYEFLPATEAPRLLEKLEFHFTPPHGNWFNMIEIDLSVLVS
jgi:hypothetical protein